MYTLKSNLQELPNSRS